MENIEIKWYKDENGKKYLVSSGISKKIDINEDIKEIKNAKAFFREIIYQSFLNNWSKKILLVDDSENEVAEVKTIINELIELCNNEIDVMIVQE